MQALSRVIFALLVTLILIVPQLTAQAASKSEIKQILAAAKKYAGSSDAVNKSELKLIKKVKNYAFVTIAPEPMYKGQWEGAGIILEKIGDKWIGRYLGSDLSDWEQKMPELFR